MSQHPQDPVQLAEQIRILLEVPDSEARLREMLHGVRPEDIALVLDDLSPQETWMVFSAIGTAAQAEVIDDTDATSQEQIIGHLDTGLLQKILEEMPPDERIRKLDFALPGLRFQGGHLAAFTQHIMQSMDI